MGTARAPARARAWAQARAWAWALARTDQAKTKKTSLKYLMNQAWNANPFSQLASHSPLAERFLFMELTLHPPKNLQFTELVGQMRADHG